MLQPLLMVCFIAVFLRDAAGPPWLSAWVSPAAGAAISISLLSSIAAAAHVLIWRCGRRLSSTGETLWIGRADRVVVGAWVAATLVHSLNVLGLGWLDAVRLVVGNVLILDEAVALAPVIGVILIVWWSLYPVDRRVREASLIRDLDDGTPVYRQMTRGDFVLMAARHQLAIILVPVFLVMAWSEGVSWAAWAWFEVPRGTHDAGGAALAMFGLQAAGTLGVFTLMPPLMRRVWDTEPLGHGQMRERLDELCRRHRVRNRELLVWRTRGTMINGAVMGLFAPVRYILLTDALLDNLSDEQVEAVMAHEVGHVRRHHMAWLGLSIIVALIGVTALAGLVVAVLEVPEAALRWLDVPVTVAALAIAIVIFGLVSRRFEWQADAFAAQHLTRFPPGSGGSAAAISAEAVRAMSGALQAVADLNHVPVARFSWRHGSILTRQNRLATLVGMPIDRLPIDRQVRRVKVLALLGLAATVALIAAQAVLPGTMTP